MAADVAMTALPSAWILEARAHYKNSLIEFPVIMFGKFMCPAVSSFMAEALALESCTEIFCKIDIEIIYT